MSVVLSLQDVGPCRKQLKVEVPAPAVEAETQRVVREYGQKVRLPGFRQGKVPSELVRRRFAKDIDQEVKERLLPRYWQQAQAESSLDPLLPPEVDEVSELAPGEPLTFVATVETRPADRAAQHSTDFDLPDPEVDPGHHGDRGDDRRTSASRCPSGCRSSGRPRAATASACRSPPSAPPSIRRSGPTR